MAAKKPSKLYTSLRQVGRMGMAGGIGAIASGEFVTGVAVLIVGAFVWGLSEYKDELAKYFESLSE